MRKTLEKAFCRINPCIIIPPWWASLFVALIDIAIGGVTLYGSLLALYHFKDARKYLAYCDFDEDVAWFGIVSIPVVALVGVFSGVQLIGTIISRESNGSHVWKFLVFFVAEVLGFILPYYVFTDYKLKIEALHENLPLLKSNFTVYRLLEVNYATIVLFIYQPFSFWVVHRYEVLKTKEKGNSASVQNLIQNQDHRSAHATVEMTKMIPEENVYTKSPTLPQRPRRFQRPGAGAGGVRAGNRPKPRAPTPGVADGFYNTADHGRGRSTTRSTSQASYPDLESIRGEMATLPSFAKLMNMKVKSTRLNIDIDVDGDPVDIDDANANTLVKRRPLTQFELDKRRYADPDDYFEDGDFPPCAASLGSARGGIKWLRPHEIHENAQFFTDGESRFDVKQGALGDCWFIASVANLTLNKKYFSHVVPIDNEWALGGIYAGMCHFRFHDGQEWVEVTIDDRLPTQGGKLIYMHSSDPTEFWSALLEKAYAKFNGSYASLAGNDGMGRGLMQLTGGKVRRLLLAEFMRDPEKLFNKICDALERHHMVGICATKGASQVGICGSHAYSVTHSSEILFRSGTKMHCLRIRNPWGDGEEWNGDFSDNNSIWDMVDWKTKRDLEVKYLDDGEFWIPLEKVIVHFDFVEICKVQPRPA